jgi:tetratricopeptide (TPR) repeat protein
MKKVKHYYVVLIIAGIILTLAGCESYAEKKAAAQLKWEKTTAKAKVSVARDLYANGRIDDAFDTVTKCLKVDPEMPQAHLLLGEIRLAQARIDEAEKSLQTAIRLDENLHKAWFLLGSIQQVKNQLQRACESYEIALRLQPANPDYVIAMAEMDIAQGRTDKALELLMTKTSLLPSEALLKIETADVLSRMGRTKEAINLYNQALLHKPGDETIIEALGYCYITDQQWDKAVKMFETLHKNALDSDKSSTYLNILAMCSMNDGQYGRAVQLYDSLSLEQRDNPDLWLQMGQAALGIDAPKRALACAVRALALKPDWVDALALKGCAQYLNNDYSSAVQTFSKITADEKMAAFAWLMTGRCYQQLGDTDLADKAYQNASELNPDSELVTLLIKQKT